MEQSVFRQKYFKIVSKVFIPAKYTLNVLAALLRLICGKLIESQKEI